MHDDQGTTTIAGAMIGAALVSLALLALWLGAAASARHRAQATADLAALAAAGQSQVAGGDGCGAASRVAALMRARVTECRPDGADVLVWVEVAPRITLAGLGPAIARARAGPAADGS